MRTIPLGSAARERFPDFRVRLLSRTASTQNIVRAAAGRGAAAGYCCVAMEQTAGRGRQGRSWSAPPGAGLLTSILLDTEPRALPMVPIAAGLAIADAITAATGVFVQLKWPNDVMAGGRKLAGILAETENSSVRPAMVVLGIGVNLSVEEFPEGVHGVSLHTLVSPVPAWEVLLGAILDSLVLHLGILEAGDSQRLQAEWRRRSVGLGEVATATINGRRLTGVALDIDGDGALLLATAQGTLRVLAGDIHIGL